MWRAVEPLHAVTYFAPEPRAFCDALGTKGFWMSYFAQRAAPLGAAPPELVTALFYNFHPALVARAVPDVWAVASPARFLQARSDGVDAALRRLLGPDTIASAELAEAAEIARAAALAAPTAGRALAAANAALGWPDAPHLVLWHAQTVLREQRGDGHVAALLTAGLDPAEALVLFAADSALDADWMRQRRGWSEQEWAAAVQRLVARGLFVADGAGADGAGADGAGADGAGADGAGADGAGADGAGADGAGADGVKADGVGTEGVGTEGVGTEGVGAEGVGAEGVGAEGVGAEGVGAEGVKADGVKADGAEADGACPGGNGLTAAGRALRDEVEARTDALADVPWQAVGAARAERLVELMSPLVSAVLAGAGFLPVNPMGLRPLVRA